VSDQDLPGTIAGTDLVLTLKAKVGSPADFNFDGDVDGNDLTLLDNCFSNPKVSFDAGCEDRDLDADGDVDQADFGIFQRCYAGPGHAPPAHCAY
jgi:hypothetical protein